VEQIRVARSFISADSLAEIVEKNYDLDGPVSCKMFSKLLRTQDNDHYRVNAGSDSYALRIYQNGDAIGRQESDYLFELEPARLPPHPPQRRLAGWQAGRA
jgi:Ser/Thr protein kinase RdoA (MazF antagonist)